MKNILLFFLLISYYTANAQNFGVDKICFDTTSVQVYDEYLQTAFNGWIFVGFNYYDMPNTGYKVLKSVDNGVTWTTIIDYSVTPGSAYYPQITKMIVAGSNTTNLRLFLTLNGPGNAGPGKVGIVESYNAFDGTLINRYNLGYFIDDIKLTSDDHNPLSSSSPYSVAVAYTTSDSLHLFYSTDGGLNFATSTIATDTSNFAQIDISYGSGNTTGTGNYGITFMKGNNIGVIFSATNNPIIFSPFTIIDTVDSFTNGQCFFPKIIMQNSNYQNTSLDYTSVIIANRNAVSGTTNLVSFYQSSGQSNGNWNMEIIDTATTTKYLPEIIFNQIDSDFIFTYFDATNNQLPLFHHSTNFPGTWNRFNTDYPDTMKFLSPYPKLSFDTINSISCIWKQLGDSTGLWFVPEAIKFDNISSLVSVPNIDNMQFNFILYPNPTVENAKIHFTKSVGKIKISVNNSTGNLIFDQTIDTNNNLDFQLPKISSGIYSLTIQNNQQINTSKFIQLE